MRKLWDRTPLAMWSLSTVDAQGNGNMNICGYVTSISLQPRIMLLAVYHHTKTHQNIKHEPRALLQLLTSKHIDIVRTCGRQSGNSIDKIAKVAKKHPVAYHKGLPYFTDCAGFMELDITDLREIGGDHLLATAEVVASQNLVDATILTNDYLRVHGIIR
jgi:flavin reductase (DIM6/NTAB) family NADH-FMN oxidoreductase RutF